MIIIIIVVMLCYVVPFHPIRSIFSSGVYWHYQEKLRVILHEGLVGNNFLTRRPPVMAHQVVNDYSSSTYKTGVLQYDAQMISMYMWFC